QVGLTMRGGVDDRVEPVTVGLVAVQREVLERRHHALALDAVDLCGREDGAEIGVLGEVLEVAAIAGVPCKVAPTSELDVEATRPGLPRDRLTSLPHHLRVEAGTERDERRVCS